MKRSHAIIAGLLACLLLATATAAEGDKQRRRQGIDRAQILKQFDTNGDGRLDEAEKAKAKEAFEDRKRQGNRPGQGKAGQGRPGQAGQTQGRPNFREILQRFDADGNGRLSEQEKAAARAEFEKMRRGQAGNNGVAGRIPPQALKRFDKDGDGRLNEREQAAAMKAREEFMKKNGNAGRGGQGNMKQLIARFDKDGDGKLDETERAEIARLRRQGGVEDRPASQAEEKPGRVDKKELLAKFDSDGDGKLSGEEKAAARAAFQDRDKEER